MAENGKIRFPESDNPSLPPPTGSFYVWLSTDGFFKKMDSAGNVTNLSVQSIGDMTDVDLTGLQNGQVLVWNQATGTWIPADMSGGVETFVELTDTPSQYTGMAGKVATVNQAENALEFTDKLPADGFVESVNGETGVVVLDADDIDDSTTTHKFATQAQLDQIATNTTNISTNAGDIAGLETDFGDLETQVNTNTGDISANTSNIATNTGNISTNASNIATNASDISDLQDQIDGGVGKTYTGVEAIEVNNTDDQVSLKLTEDNSGQFDSMTVSGFNSDFNHSFEVVKRDGERVNIDLDLEGQSIILNYDSGTHQLYRCLTHDNMFIGFCDEIGYWIAVKLTVSHAFDVNLNGTATLGLENWVQLGTLSTLLGNGNYVPSSSYLNYTGFAVNNSYLSQSVNGLTANVSSDLSAAQAFELADALDVKQALDLKLTDPTTGLDTVNRPYYLERTLFNNDIIIDTWVQTSTLGGDDPRWTADPVKLGQDAGLTNQGVQSVAIGLEAADTNQGGSAIAIGFQAGEDTQEDFCIGIGYRAGQTTQGTGSVAVGKWAGQTNQGEGCFAFGQSAGGLNQGDFAMGIGTNAGQTSQGTRSVALGYNSGNATQGDSCVSIGELTAQNNQGQYSVAIGRRAGQNNQPSESIVIASGQFESTPTATQQIRIGLSNYDVQIGDGNVSSVSDARDKYDVQDIPLGLDFVNALQPKFYKYDIRELYEETDDEGVVTKNVPDRSLAGIRFHSGFIAQDVKEAMDSFGVDFGVYRDETIKAEEVHKERASGKLSLCYREFIAIQTKAIQELSAKVDLLKAEVTYLKGL